MGVQEKTASLVRISNCPLSVLEKNVANPNKMSARAFDLLCDNMQLTGWTDPALVRPVNLPMMLDAVKHAKGDEAALVKLLTANNVKLRIVGGHHRFDAAQYLGLETGPVTVIMDPEFDADMETFQVVRMNVIHGQMDPNKFAEMVNGLSKKYSDDVMQESFGFAEEAEFRKLVNHMAKSLPNKAAQDKFKEAAKEIKTIDGLAKLLNHMFTQYGDTLKHGYMIVDYGGQESVWLQASKKTRDALMLIGQMCVVQQRTMDDIVGEVLHLIAVEGESEFLKALVAQTAHTPIPKAFGAPPTKDNLAKLKENL